MKSYYNKRYFDWQKKAGLYGATQDIRFYEKSITSTDTVLDFGCGGGYILAALPCKVKYGVDINEQALIQASSKGIRTFTSLDALPKNKKFDVIITHHTLEHVENPAEILITLRKLLTKKGVLIGVLPLDDWRSQKNYKMKDMNNHLYTWTPLLLANLLKASGYRIRDISIITSAWLPLSRFYYQYIPRPLYDLAAGMWSILIRSRQLKFIVTART